MEKQISQHMYFHGTIRINCLIGSGPKSQEDIGKALAMTEFEVLTILSALFVNERVEPVEPLVRGGAVRWGHKKRAGV